MKLFFPIFLALCFIFYSQLKRSTNTQNSQSEAFWQKELEANQTRKQNIDNLNYITIPFEKLPFLDNPSKNISSYEKDIRSLEGKRILNLNGITNTELKLTYGAANLSHLTNYDDNHTRMVTIFDRWSNSLLDEGYTDEAQLLLEIAIDCGCDSGNIFLRLNNIYNSKGIDKKDYLIAKVNNINTSMKDIILRKLNS